MALALSLATEGRDKLLSRLIIVDIAPMKFPLPAEIEKYIDGMLAVNALPPGAITSREQVDSLLKSYTPVYLPTLVHARF